MALDKICFIRSVGTDIFYDAEEQAIHNEMLKLYKLRAKPAIPKWKKTVVNRMLKRRKQKLTEILDSKKGHGLVRDMNPEKFNNKSVISLFESELTRVCGLKPGELSEDIFSVEFYFYQVLHDLIFNGFNYNGKHYVYFSSSAGAIRKHRGLFIEEQLLNRVWMTLTCGLSREEVNKRGGCIINKWLAYTSLNGSATDVWEDFDIDKAIVVDDHELMVWGQMDCIDTATYEITNQYTSTSVPMNDGASMMLPECGTTRVLRAPFLKGLCIAFPFDKFLREKCTPDQWIVKDIYGKEYNIIEDGIKYILTKSCFKLWNRYSSWDEYKANFKKYGCHMCYCNEERPYVPKAQINYQMLQTLYDIKDNEIDKLLKFTNKEIDNVGEDYRTNMKLLGAMPYNQTPNYFQQGLMLYPELFRDAYHREILKQTKRSLVKQAKAGRLRVNGYYRLVSPDLYAFCEWLFQHKENPDGLLQDGEVSISQFGNCAELDCLRSPHLYFEHCVRRNRNDEETKKWFVTKCLYTSCHDLISKILCLDWDGDQCLVVKNNTLNKIIKRIQQRFYPLNYKMGHADPVEVNPQNIYNGLIAAFKYGKIGIYSNSCSKIWNSGEITEEKKKALAWLVAESNFSIDAAKTLQMIERPADKNEIIKPLIHGKLPHYFKYAKDKTNEQVEPPNQSFMNRLPEHVNGWSMRKDKNGDDIEAVKIKYCKTVGKFDYRMLMKEGVDYTVQEDHPIIQAYNYWNAHQAEFNEENDNVDDDDAYATKFIRDKILTTGYNVDYVTNSLVAYMYTVKTNSQKKLLWSCFGAEIVENLKVNTPKLGKICPICGRRFKPQFVGGSQIEQMYCSQECTEEANREIAFEKWCNC